MNGLRFFQGFWPSLLIRMCFFNFLKVQNSFHTSLFELCRPSAFFQLLQLFIINLFELFLLDVSRMPKIA